MPVEPVPPVLSEDTLAQLRLGHLQMIQGIIGRIAGFSATVKNFSVTLAAAAVAVSFTDKPLGLLWIPLVAVALLLTLDAYYLAQERAFRTLYDEVARRPLTGAADVTITRPRLQPFAASRSFSVWGFYAPQLIIIAILLSMT